MVKITLWMGKDVGDSGIIISFIPDFKIDGYTFEAERQKRDAEVMECVIAYF